MVDTRGRKTLDIMAAVEFSSLFEYECSLQVSQVALAREVLRDPLANELPKTIEMTRKWLGVVRLTTLLRKRSPPIGVRKSAIRN